MTTAQTKAQRLQRLRQAGQGATQRTSYRVIQTSRSKPERSKWFIRRNYQLLESVGVVLLLALFVGVEMGLAI